MYGAGGIHPTLASVDPLGHDAVADAIPIALRGAAGRWFRLGMVALLACLSASFFFSRFSLPGDWLYLTLGALFLFILAGSVYVGSLGRRAHVASILDFGCYLAVQSIKCLLIANVIWSAAALLDGVTPIGAVWIFCDRALNLPDYLGGAAGLNILQAAMLVPWHSPTRGTMRAIGRGRRFARQLRPGLERKIAHRLRTARASIGKGQAGRAHAALDEATELLIRAAAPATDRPLLHHLKRIEIEINLLRVQAGGRPNAKVEAGDDPATRPAGAEAQVTNTGSAPRPAQHAAGFEQYREFVESLRVQAPVDWSGIAGIEDVVKEIKTAFALGLAESPEGVDLEPTTRILLYGPPGTGKTLLSAAISNTFGVPFYSLKVSDVLSKYFGESPKLISAVFDIVGRQAPAVIFFDEIESIGGSREGGGMEGEERRILTTLLAELDGLKSKQRAAPLFTIAATNMPWQLDPALLSRFEKQFHIPLPDSSARARIIELNLAGKGFRCETPPEKLVQFTRGYSGRELSRLCKEAVSHMMSDANPNLETLAEGGKPARLKVQPITAPHLNAAFKRVRPQTDPALLARYQTWGEAA